MSTIKVDTIQNASGVEQYTCKAWVNFNGTGTVAIRSSGNVSSITDLGVGQYYVNFTVAMIDLDYAVISSSRNSGVTASITSPAVSTAGIAYVNNLGGVSLGNYDSNQIYVAIFR